jgi:hypothetical protein
MTLPLWQPLAKQTVTDITQTSVIQSPLTAGFFMPFVTRHVT